MSANRHDKFREWSINEDLPPAFVKFLKESVANRQARVKGLIPIAQEIGVTPALLSRWLGGKGTLKEADIRQLAKIFGSSVYITLGLEEPDNPHKRTNREKKVRILLG